MKQGKDNPPYSQSPSPREKQVKDIDQLLGPLVEARCRRERLLSYLRSVKVAYDVYDKNRPDKPSLQNVRELIPRFTFDDYFGFDRKSLKTVLKRMRQCAKDVEALSSKLGSGWVLQVFVGGSNAAPGFVVPDIPHWLHIFASAVKKEAKQAMFRERTIYDNALEVLLRYVRKTTGQWYYEKVAALLRAAVTLKETPDGAALRAWVRTRPALRSLLRKS